MQPFPGSPLATSSYANLQVRAERSGEQVRPPRLAGRVLKPVEHVVVPLSGRSSTANNASLDPRAALLRSGNKPPLPRPTASSACSVSPNQVHEMWPAPQPLLAATIRSGSLPAGQRQVVLARVAAMLG